MKAIVLCSACGHSDQDHAGGACRGEVYPIGTCTCKSPIYVTLKSRSELADFHRRAYEESERVSESSRNAEGAYVFTASASDPVVLAKAKEIHLWHLVCDAMREPLD